MKEFPLKRKLSIFAFFVAATSFVGNYARAESGPLLETSGWFGTAGVGPMIFSRYTGGTETQTWILPLISANYDEVLYIEPLRANIYLASSEDKKMGFGLAVEPRMGFHSSDGAKLAGMVTRRNSLEGGFNFDWDVSIIAISVSYLTDLTHSSKGTSSRVYFYKDFLKNEKWRLGANLGADHMSAKVTNYFFGIMAAEVMANRPLYQPGSATNVVFGVDGSYKLNEHNSFVFGLQANHLNGSSSNSPIIETRLTKVGWAGFAWNL